MRRVLITGAAGNLGAKLRGHLAARGDYELVLLDRDSAGDPSLIVADLGTYDTAWTDLFAGVDTVVHLAADGSLFAEWPSLVHNNIDAPLNVFAAAATHRVRRVVFASSVQTMRGHGRSPERRITHALDTKPINFYGATKVFGERLARSYAQRHGLSAICLRIGWIPLVNTAAAARAVRPDLQRLWLSDRDFCGYLERAINVADPHFAIVNAISNIAGSNWDLEEGARVLGYAPKDDWTPDNGVVTRLRYALTDFLARITNRLTQLLRAG